MYKIAAIKNNYHRKGRNTHVPQKRCQDLTQAYHLFGETCMAPLSKHMSTIPPLLCATAACAEIPSAATIARTRGIANLGKKHPPPEIIHVRNGRYESCIKTIAIPQLSPVEACAHCNNPATRESKIGRTGTSAASR